MTEENRFFYCFFSASRRRRLLCPILMSDRNKNLIGADRQSEIARAEKRGLLLVVRETFAAFPAYVFVLASTPCVSPLSLSPIFFLLFPKANMYIHYTNICMYVCIAFSSRGLIFHVLGCPFPSFCLGPLRVSRKGWGVSFFGS